MLQTTDIYLQRLLALRDEGFPLAFTARERGHLDFGVYRSICGTYRCLLGWWVATPTAQADGWHFRDSLPVWEGYRRFKAAKVYFDLGHSKAEALFGEGDMGDLEPRLAYLDRLIAERKSEVAA